MKENKYQFIALYIKCVPSSAKRASQQRLRLVLLLQDLLVSFLAACLVWELSVKHWFSALHHLRLVARARNNITDTRKKDVRYPTKLLFFSYLELGIGITLFHHRSSSIDY
jgi:hypothetical protein